MGKENPIVIRFNGNGRAGYDVSFEGPENLTSTPDAHQVDVMNQAAGRAHSTATPDYKARHNYDSAQGRQLPRNGQY